jgi:RimJ/RimL family protein N-acetyltransferase
MTEAPLLVAARAVEERDTPIVAPAFQDPRVGGRGLATQAVRSVAREAFASGLWRIEANVRIGNDASERVLERAGFTREGVKRRLLRRGNERVDATAFSLLADDG